MRKLTDDQRAAQYASHKKWRNKPENKAKRYKRAKEHREENGDRIRAGRRAECAGRTPEERARVASNDRKARLKRLEIETPEAKEVRLRLSREWAANVSPEQVQRRKDTLRRGAVRRRAAMSREELVAFDKAKYDRYKARKEAKANHG